MDAILQTTFSKSIFLNENAWISIKISLKFVPEGPNNKIPAFDRRQAIGPAPSQYLNQWWLVYWRIYALLGINELTHWSFFEQRPEHFKYQRHAIVDISRAKMVTAG